MGKKEAGFVTVAKIGSTYGVHGWLKIFTYTEFGASILDYTPWYLSKGSDAWEIIEIEARKLHGRLVIAKFAGFNSPETARVLTGKTIAVSRSQLPELKKDEYYWSDLVGLTVINKTGDVLGKVIYLMETGSNDVLVVKGKQEFAIPFFSGEVILEVDLKKREIHVDWELL